MAVASGNFAELLWPGIKEIWQNDYSDYEPLYAKLFRQMKSDKRFEKFQGVTGLPLAGVKDEGSPVSYVDLFQGYQKEFVNVTYGLGATVTREMFDDDMYSYINTIPKKLSRSMRHTEETIAFNHLNRAFNSSYTGADGVSLCNDSHPLVGGGTYRNQLATAADLTQTSLEQALQDLMDFVDDQGLKIRVMPKKLIVATQNNFKARKILESEFVTGSADNDKNGIPGLFDGLVVSPWLTDADAWFIKTDIEEGLTWLNRREAELTRDNEFDTENLKFKVTRRFSSGWVDARGIFGTAGS